MSVPMSLLMSYVALHLILCFFFFNDTATTEIYTLSLHDALPIPGRPARRADRCGPARRPSIPRRDRKSTRLNSSHVSISYAVFCLKKKNPIDAADDLFINISHAARPGEDERVI